MNFEPFAHVRLFLVYSNMAATKEVSQLFSDLEQCEKSGNYIKGLKIANKSKMLLSIEFLCCVFLCFAQYLNVDCDE